MVKTTAMVLLNFNFRLKNKTKGLPISDITAATAIYTIARADLWYIQTNVRTYGNPGTGTGGHKAN